MEESLKQTERGAQSPELTIWVSSTNRTPRAPPHSCLYTGGSSLPPEGMLRSRNLCALTLGGRCSTGSSRGRADRAAPITSPRALCGQGASR